MLNKIKNIALIFLTALVVFLIIFKGCEKPVKPVETNTKIEKSEEKTVKLKDSVRVRDSVVVRWHDRFRFDKTNPLKLPCDTFVKIIIAECDTVIQKDTLEIIALKKVVMQQDTTISYQQEQRTKDSTLIPKLEKKIKLWKGIAKGAFFTGAAAGGYVGFKLH